MKTTRLRAAALALALAGMGSAWAQPGGIRQESVQFTKGSSEAAIKATLRGDQTVDYLVRASAGQTLSVSLQRSNLQTYFNVLPPGSNDAAMFVLQDGAGYQGTLPDDGVYKLRVYLMRAAARRGAARRNEKSDYTLTVAVAGKPLAALPAAQDAKVPGTRFHATAQLPCRPPFAAAARQCDAAVVRRGHDGTATVEVRSGDRVVRRILSVAGKPVASDSAEAMSSAREADGSRVRFGDDEGYTVPDALLQGG